MPVVGTSIKFLATRVSPRLGDHLLRFTPRALTDFTAFVEYRGLEVSVYTGEELGRRIYYKDQYEPVQEEALLGLVRSGMRIFDVGANIGIYALQAARLGATVVAFEPSRLVRHRLVRNIVANRLTESITVVPEAVAAKQGTVEFFETRTGNWGVGRIFAYGHALRGGERYSVPTDSLDNLALRFGTPDLIKMDIEGAEYLAVQGATTLFSSPTAPLLMIEFHPDEIVALGGTLDATTGVLQESGYRRSCIRGCRDGSHSWLLFSRFEVSSPAFSAC